MQFRNTPGGWALPSKLLHWVVALLFIGMLAFGNYISRVEDVYEAFGLIQWHKSFGSLAFGLVVLRIFWRLFAGAAELPASVPRWQAAASRASHLLLYALMVALPVTGWLYASASPAQDLYGIRNMVFGLFELPDPFRPGNQELADLLGFAHATEAKLLIGLVVLHLAAALKHHFVDRDAILRRMWF